MLWLLIPLLAGTTGLFIGSQIDDAVEKKFEPVKPAPKQDSLPLYVRIPLIVAGGTAAFIITKKAIKKIVKE